MGGFTRAAACVSGIVDDRCCCWFRSINLTSRVLRQEITAHLRLLSVGMTGENPEKCLRDKSVGIAACLRNQRLREMFRLAQSQFAVRQRESLLGHDAGPAFVTLGHARAVKNLQELDFLLGGNAEIEAASFRSQPKVLINVRT